MKKFESLVPDIGERAKIDMKKKSKKTGYLNESVKLGKRVRDFLPSPAEIALREKTTRVTINLNEASLKIFKKEASRLGVPYQRLLRTVVDLYAQNYMSETNS